MTAALADFSSLRTLVDLLRWRAQHDPYQRAYIFLADGEVEESSVTYAELDRQARAIAAWLQVTTGPGERALLFYPPGLRYIASFFGCLYAGIIAVPAYPPQPNRTLQRIETMAIDAEATLALAQEPTRTALKPLFDSSAALQGIGLETPPEGDDGHHDWRVPSLSGDTLAMLQYTSGSTGTPRGVMVAHDNLMNNLAAMAYAFEGTPRGAVPSGFHLDPAQHCGVVSWLPPYHDMGLIGGILLPLYAGRPAALMPPAPFLQRPVRWLQAISRYRATYSIGPNFAFDLCVRRITPEQRSQLSLDGWEMAICGAEPIRAESLHRFASTFAGAGFRPAAFYPCYGLAEATLMVAGRQAGQAMVTKTLDSGALERNRVVDADGGADARIVVGCGRAVLDQRIVIVRPEESTLCTPGEVGEIWVSGPSVASGYWNRPEGSTQTFQARIIPTGEGPYLRTGDLGFLDGGELFVTGRIDDVIIVRGRNHYPHDIEASVERSHPALRPNAGVAFAVEVDGEYRLVIVHEVERPLGIDVEEVAGAVRQAVAEGHELQVADVVLVRPGSIPKTSSGKLQRRACRANYLASALPVVGVWRAIIARERSAPAPEATPAPLAGRERPTKDEIELWLVTKLGERLGVDARHIDVDQPLARHGLDSKEAVVLASELEEWLGVSLPVTLAYE